MQGNAGVIPKCCGEEGAEPEGKAFILPVARRSNPQPATYGHELWVVTGRLKQVLSGVAGLRSLEG